MKKHFVVLLFLVVVASGCVNQSEGTGFDSQKFQEVNGLQVSYDDSVPDSYVQNFAETFNSSDDIDRVAFQNTGEGYGIKIYTKRSSVDNINNLDTQETADRISSELFDGAEVTLYLATMEGEVAQKASTK